MKHYLKKIMLVTEKQYYTQEEYLVLEEAADYKSDYIDGSIIPRSGETTNHNQIALNLSTELKLAFKKQNYEVFMSNLRLWIPQRRIYTYPDVMIIVGKPECVSNRRDIITNPQVIVEVLSESAQLYHHDNKFEAYRTIDTFKEYLLIYQTQKKVEQYFKTGEKQWLFSEFDEEDDMIDLASLSFEMSMQDLYNKVEFDAGENQTA